MITPDEARRRLASVEAWGGWTLLALKVLWEIVDAASNVEYVLDKAPTLKRVVMPILSSNTLIVAAVLWLLFVVMRPSHWSLHWTRVGRAKRLLSEAIEIFSSEPVDIRNNDAVHHAAWELVQIHSFVQMAFGDRTRQDLADYTDSEQRRYREADRPFDHRQAVARFLKRLRGNLNSSNVDPGFLIPDSYRQFADQDGWPANRV
jgi:hypothetical protein